MSEPQTTDSDPRQPRRDRRRAAAIVAQYIRELATVSAASSADT